MVLTNTPFKLKIMRNVQKKPSFTTSFKCQEAFIKLSWRHYIIAWKLSPTCSHITSNISRQSVEESMENTLPDVLCNLLLKTLFLYIEVFWYSLLFSFEIVHSIPDHYDMLMWQFSWEENTKLYKIKISYINISIWNATLS